MSAIRVQDAFHPSFGSASVECNLGIAAIQALRLETVTLIPYFGSAAALDARSSARMIWRDRWVPDDYAASPQHCSARSFTRPPPLAC